MRPMRDIFLENFPENAFMTLLGLSILAILFGVAAQMYTTRLVWRVGGRDADVADSFIWVAGYGFAVVPLGMSWLVLVNPEWLQINWVTWPLGLGGSLFLLWGILLPALATFYNVDLSKRIAATCHVVSGDPTL